MSEEPSAGQVILGIFLILFGLCIALVGGGCTLLWLSAIGQPGMGGILNPLFLISLVTLGGGIAIIYGGAKLLSRK